MDEPRDAEVGAGESREVTRSGFVALLGRPNAGKSTLLNRMLGEKLAIVSPKPQTTRNRITGVLTRDGVQAVFFDTPGVHRSDKPLNRHMTREAYATLGEVDAVIFLVDSKQLPGEDDRDLAQRLKTVDVPVFLAVNKVDAGVHRTHDFEELGTFTSIHEISALTGEGVEGLLAALLASLPEGPAYFPEDALTDRPERFIAEEFIREKVFQLTGEEIPYSCAVTVEMWKDQPEKNLAVIHATIHVERESQKPILIGKGGAMIRQVGQKAREDLERLLGIRIFLDLHVHVEHNWTKDPVKMRRLGYETKS